MLDSSQFGQDPAPEEPIETFGSPAEPEPAPAEPAPESAPTEPQTPADSPIKVSFPEDAQAGPLPVNLDVPS